LLHTTPSTATYIIAEKLLTQTMVAPRHVVTLRTLALMGFSTEQSRGALNATGGDVEAAVELLLAAAGDPGAAAGAGNPEP
jgi:uncharacterized UBP type Zn finger protein